MLRNATLAFTLALAACGGPAIQEDPAHDAHALSQATSELPGESVDDLGNRLVSDGMLPDAVPAAATLTPETSEDAAVGPRTVYTLRRGETLAHFARWSGIPVEEIAEASGLDLAETLAVGTEVAVPRAAADLAELDSLREAHQQVRIDNYIASRGGEVGVETYAVRTGDSAWSIAKNHQGIPVWLVESYNPDLDLEALRPGQSIDLPILADTVFAESDILESQIGQ